MRSEISEAMGEWLGRIAPWDVFATWTFARPVTLYGAMDRARKHARSLEDMAGQPVYAFVAVEEGAGGLAHLHALIGNVAHLRPTCGTSLPVGRRGERCCLRDAWAYGYARVFKYDPARGARFYVAKHITKALAEWDLIGLPPAAQLAFCSVWQPGAWQGREVCQAGPLVRPQWGGLPIQAASADLESGAFRAVRVKGGRVPSGWAYDRLAQGSTAERMVERKTIHPGRTSRRPRL